MNSYYQCLLNAKVDYGQDNITLTIDWYRYIPEFSEWEDMSGVPDDVLTGYMWGGGIKVNGTIEVVIDCFYECDGKQYAIGQVTIYDGSTAYIGLVRP